MSLERPRVWPRKKRERERELTGGSHLPTKNLPQTLTNEGKSFHWLSEKCNCNQDVNFAWVITKNYFTCMYYLLAPSFEAWRMCYEVFSFFVVVWRHFFHLWMRTSRSKVNETTTWHCFLSCLASASLISVLHHPRRRTRTEYKSCHWIYYSRCRRNLFGRMSREKTVEFRSDFKQKQNCTTGQLKEKVLCAVKVWKIQSEKV